MKKISDAQDWLASNNAGSRWAWPWAMLRGGIRVLPVFEKMFPGWDSKNPAIADAAHWKAALAQVMTCAAVLGAGLAGGAKVLTYAARRGGVGDSNNPASGIKSKLNATYDPFSNITVKKDSKKKEETDQFGQVKEAKEDRMWTLPYPDKLSLKTMSSFAVPALTLFLAAGVSDRVIDSWTEGIDDARISKKLEDRDKLVNDLVLARAKNAKGNLTDKEFSDLERRIDAAGIGFKKTANILDDAAEQIMTWLGKMPAQPEEPGKLTRIWNESTRDLVAATGMLALGLMGVSAVGMYYHTQRSDPANIRYRAMKKGLQEYAKNKSGMSPITIMEPGEAFLNAVDGPDGGATAGKPLPPREYQDMSQFSANNPVSVSFD